MAVHAPLVSMETVCCGQAVPAQLREMRTWAFPCMESQEVQSHSCKSSLHESNKKNSFLLFLFKNIFFLFERDREQVSCTG